MNRSLYRCRHDRRIAGVAAGVAEFFGLDPTAVRVLWFLSIFFGGFSLVLYIALALIVPLEPIAIADASSAAGESAGEAAGAGAVGPVHVHAGLAGVGAGSGPGVGALGGRFVTLVGATLVVLGAIALVDVLVPGAHSWRYAWPLAVVGVGALLVVGAIRRESNGA